MFKSKRIKYTHLKECDAEFTFGLRNGNFEESKYLIISPLPTSLSREKDWISKLYDNNNQAYFAIRKIESDIMIGYCFLRDINYLHRYCFVGIIISKDEQGKGYGTEAINFISGYGLNILGLNKIVAYVLRNNISSLKIFEKNGYKKEGCLKSHYFISGDFYDCYILCKHKKRKR